jgi:OmcA/MtrC family decaheme c-type cytochrome
MHNPPTGTATATITSVTFNPDNAVVTFTFTATDTAGNPVPADILLTPSGSNLAYARFTIAKLVPGLEFPRSGGTYRTPDEWFHYGPRSHRSPSQLTFSGGVYTFTFVEDVVLNLSEAGYTHRAGIEIYGIPNGPRSVNPTFDFVPDQAGPSYTFAQTRDIVTTAACNECHDPLGYTPSFHGSRRVETKYCGLCHNANNDLAPQSGALGAPSVPIPFAKAIHGLHTGQDLLVFEDGVNHGDFTEITYPAWQDIRNCTKCHKGAANSGNWRTVPSITACGSCHTDVNFATGTGHLGGSQNNTTCGLCHNPDVLDIELSHRTVNATPNNPNVPSGLAIFKYFIDNVAVDGAGVASVTFRIQKNGAPLDLSTYPPAGFTGGPSFLLAWALPQDGISAPADYNNRNSPAPPSSSTGNGAGDAPSVSLASVAGSLTVLDNTAKQYRASLTSSPFPAGAIMRAVAIQSYFTQTAAYDGNGDGVLDNIGRHTPSVVMVVPGDTVRRQVVKSGYDPVTGEPIGCLECHETIEGHGGSRVNNVQVCVFCHNPNKSSSGRTVDPANINPEVVAALGSEPLTYPEASNNFKNMIHGIHRASTRPYEFVRNFRNGSYYNWSDVTFPGDLKDCTKCHIGDTYRPEKLPAGVLYNVERTTTGNPSETRADIIAARASVPNSTDLVDSPIAGACYYCHDSALAKSHFLQNGGTIGSTREDGIIIVAPSP